MSLDTNLVSYWKLDESSGNASDSKGSNTLTNNNTTTYVAAKRNNGADFERGSNQYLSIADGSQSGLDITGDLSISFWYKPEDVPVNPQQFSITAKADPSTNNCGWRFQAIHTSGTPQFRFITSANGTAESSGVWNYTISGGTWYHIVVIYTASGGSAELYVNGSSQGTISSLNTSLFNNAGPFTIGNDGEAFSGRAVDGVIDEYGIWSRTLTSGEVTTLYGSGTPPAYPFGPTTYTITAAQGSYALTGYAAALGRAYVMVASVGSYILTGFAAALRKTGWTNQSKNSSSWSNGAKNSSSWTNQSKS